VAAGMAGRLVGVPAVATLHRIYYPALERRLDPLLQHLWQSVVVDSRAVRDVLMAEAGIRRTPIEVIPNFVSDEYFASDEEPSAENGPFTILMAAHFTPVKGHRFALEALARLERARPGEAQLVLLGDGPLLGESKAQVSALGLEGAVQFLGRRDDLGRWLRRADAVLLPSLWEGFGVVLAEGMAAGKPSVAFDVGGASEVIVDGETGFLTPPGDAEALADALERLRDDAALRERMGRAGRRRAEAHYTAGRVATSYERFYARVSAA
jgi:L-malate glycosyltransferase